MKRKSVLLTSVILLLCLALLLCGCQRKPKLVVGALSDVTVRDDLGITMTADAETLTGLGGEFTLYGDSDTGYSYHKFHLETLQDDGWHSIDRAFSYILMHGDPAKGTLGELSADWSAQVGRLPKGQYRLLAEVLPADGADAEPFYVACEFTIK